jgi:hypothetical protein
MINSGQNGFIMMNPSSMNKGVEKQMTLNEDLTKDVPSVTKPLITVGTTFLVAGIVRRALETGKPKKKKGNKTKKAKNKRPKTKKKKRRKRK